MYATTFHDPSPFITYITLTSKATHEDIERRIKTEYAKLAKTPPTANEMQIVKRLYRSALAGRRDGTYAFLSTINEDIARGDWALFVSFPKAIEKVKPRDVSRVVAQYLTDDSQSTIGYFVGSGTKPTPKAKKRGVKKKRTPPFRIPRTKKGKSGARRK